MKKLNNFKIKLLLKIEEEDATGPSPENSLTGLMRRMKIKDKDFIELRNALHELEDEGYIEERHFADPLGFVDYALENKGIDFINNLKKDAG